MHCRAKTVQAKSDLYDIQLEYTETMNLSLIARAV